MRVTVTIDDDLLKDAQMITGINNKSELLRKAVTEWLARESALQMAKMGGTIPNIKPIPRRRPKF